MSAPKKRLYVVHTKVFLDGDLIKQFPSEIEASGRKNAKYQIAQRISFTTGTDAIGGNWIGRYREFYVQLYVRYEGKILHSFAAKIMAQKRREAKFDITKRLSYKMGAVARKADLIKHT